MSTAHCKAPSQSTAARRLLDAWREQARARTRDELPARTPADFTLAELLLYGMTVDADEGPAVDMLTAIEDTVRGWIKTSDPEEDFVRVSTTSLVLLYRQLNVAAELVRRGAGAFPEERPETKEAANG